MFSPWTRFKRLVRRVKNYTRRRVAPFRYPRHALALDVPVFRPREEQSMYEWSATDTFGERRVSVADLCAHVGNRLPIRVVKLIARDVLRALDNLHEACGVVHCGLDLNSIVLSPYDMRALMSQLTAESRPSLPPSETSLETMFFDVNSMLTSTSQPVFSVLPSGDPDRRSLLQDVLDARALRAPELVLGAPHESSADIWALGCLVYELLAGERLFDPEFQTLDLGLTAEESYLIQMIEVLGPFPPEMLKRYPNAEQWFTDTGTMRIDTSFYPVTLEEMLHERIHPNDDGATSGFLATILKLDPGERPRAKDLVNHPWFTSL